ncbi:RsmE family RNA methyltransferase [Planctomycetota bacterium]
MHRFFIEKNAISGDEVTITGPAARQICDVLRMEPGKEIVVLDGTGREYRVSLSEVSRRDVLGHVIDVQQCLSEPRTQITLFQAHTARGKFEHILQKCTETGVVRFVPVITQRSIVRNCGKITNEKFSRRYAIITEAAEQAGRGKIPKLEKVITLEESVQCLNEFDLSLVGSPADSAVSLKKILNNSESAPVNIALFIGPEGGFSESEMEFFLGNGAITFGLGRRILRTETAAVVASAIILYELED